MSVPGWQPAPWETLHSHALSRTGCQETLHALRRTGAGGDTARAPAPRRRGRHCTCAVAHREKKHCPLTPLVEPSWELRAFSLH